eukprot:s396_g8.t1
MDGWTDGNICPTEVKLASVNLEKPKDPRRHCAIRPSPSPTGDGSARRTQTSIEGASYIQVRESKGSGLQAEVSADYSQRRVSWKGFATASDGATIATGDSDGQLVEKVATYGEGGGPLNRADDISEPMEEGSCFGAHAPLRLKDDGLVRHPGFAAETLGPLVAALMSRISCGRTSRRSEGGIAMSLPQCIGRPTTTNCAAL